MSGYRWIFPLVIALVILGLFLFSPKLAEPEPGTKDKPSTEIPGFDRDLKKIKYSKHAKCRMECREISKEEVERILEVGTFNEKKSFTKQGECLNKYALEGKGEDNHDLRIVFAPCENKITVVTVIDLDREWECPDCE